MIIKNDSVAIKKYLEKSYKEVCGLRHLGNFVFEATTSAGAIKIVTEPTTLT